MEGIQTYATALADAIEAAVPAWVERCVAVIFTAWRGELAPEVGEAARRAGEQAAADVGRRLRQLLLQDIDDQRSTPLALIREAVAYPTEVLTEAGVPAVVRDQYEEGAFPGDIYGLSPATFADVDPSIVEPAIAWGAAKAFEHKRRHAP